ncbi:oligosaccharide flippase family protein [Flavobacteriales bacterium]|nr:oligosaccharide flippase family protein [Flavobacteriales bacterium]
MSFIKTVLQAKLFKSTSKYFLFNIINKAIPFALLPILTAYLAPWEYGKLAMFNTLLGFFIPIIGMNMGMNIERNYYNISKEALSKKIFNMLILLAISFFIVESLTFTLFQYFDLTFGLSLLLMMFLPALSVLQIVQKMVMVLYRVADRPSAYGIVQISTTIINVSISLLLIISFAMGWKGRIIGISAASFIIALILLFMMHKEGFLIYKVDKKEIKGLFKISYPLIFHALGGTLIFMSDRLFIEEFEGETVLGIYSVGFAFGQIVTLIQDALAKAISPWMYKNLSLTDFKTKIKIVKTTYLYFIGMLAIAILVTLAGYVLIELMISNSDYHEGKVYILFIALSYAFNGMYKMVSPYFIVKGKTQILASSTFFVAAINVIGNYYLVQSHGALGAAYVSVGSLFIHFVVTWWLSHRFFPMPWFSFKNNKDLT